MGAVDPGFAGRLGEHAEDLLDGARLPGGEAGRHQFGAVGVGQQGVAQGTADDLDALAPAGRRRIRARRCQHLIGDRAEQLLLVGEVPIERARRHVEFAGEPAHGQVGDPVAVQDRRRLGHHVAFVQLHAFSLA